MMDWDTLRTADKTWPPAFDPAVDRVGNKNLLETTLPNKKELKLPNFNDTSPKLGGDPANGARISLLKANGYAARISIYKKETIRAERATVSTPAYRCEYLRTRGERQAKSEPSQKLTYRIESRLHIKVENCLTAKGR